MFTVLIYGVSLIVNCAFTPAAAVSDGLASGHGCGLDWVQLCCSGVSWRSRGLCESRSETRLLFSQWRLGWMMVPSCTLLLVSVQPINFTHYRLAYNTASYMF